MLGSLERSIILEKIKERRYDLTGKTIYREKSDCSYWKIIEWNDKSMCYGAIKLDDELNLTQQGGLFTPSDLIGDYIS